MLHYLSSYLDPTVLISTLGLAGITLIIFTESGLFFGFFLPGDSLLFTAGIFAGKDFINIYLLIILTFLAAVIGDNVGYAIGKSTGHTLFKNENSRFFKKKYLDKTTAFYQKHGAKAVIFARFTPIVRTFVPLFAGIANMDYKTFFKYNLIGGFLWTFTLSILGYTLGRTVPSIKQYLTPIILAIIFISFLPAIIEYIRERNEEKKKK